MSTLSQVKLICKTNNILPTKSKGQNFLINLEVILDIIQAANLFKNDVVLEVGPGLGILTEQLIKKAKKVISVELDKKLFDFLKIKFSSVNNLELINQDILNMKSETWSLKHGAYKVVANLPYNITSYFLKTFLTANNRPKDMTLLLQREVAQRVCAKPGEMSLLSVSIQLYGLPKIISFVSKNNFWPEPKVDSAILTISKIKDQAEVDNFLQGLEEKFFWQIVKIGFSARRKQLQNNLSAGLEISAVNIKKVLKKANFDPKIRAQNLSVNDWINLAKRLKIHLN